jgi:hypothetical protein
MGVKRGLFLLGKNINCKIGKEILMSKISEPKRKGGEQFRNIT